jgi:hypothetical protein
MPEQPSQIEVLLHLATGPGGDDTELDQGAEQLRRDLLELEVEQVTRRSAGPAPEGTRAVDAVELGVLIVQLLPSLPALHEMFRAALSWVGRGKGRSAVLEIDGDRLEVSGITDEQQRELIRLWAERHAAAG